MSHIDLDRIERILKSAQEKGTADGSKTSITPVQPPPDLPFRTKNGFRCHIDVFKNVQRAAALVAPKVASFELSKEGLSFRRIGPSETTLCDISIPAKSFDDFSYERKEPTVFALDMRQLKDVLKRAQPGDTTTFALRENDAQLSFYNGINREFALGFEKDAVSPSSTPLPEVKDTSKIWMLNDRLKSIVADTKTLSVGLGIRITEKEVVFLGFNDDDEEVASVPLPRADVGFLEVTSPTIPVQAVYPIEYLEPMLKNVHSEDVVLDYAAGMPVRVRLGIGIRGGVMATFFISCMVPGQGKKKREEADTADDEGMDETPGDESSDDYGENGPGEEATEEPVEAAPEPPAPAPAPEKPAKRSRKKGS